MNNLRPTLTGFYNMNYPPSNSSIYYQSYPSISTHIASAILISSNSYPTIKNRLLSRYLSKNYSL